MIRIRPRTLFDKIWEAHVVEQLDDGNYILCSAAQGP